MLSCFGQSSVVRRTASMSDKQSNGVSPHTNGVLNGKLPSDRASFLDKVLAVLKKEDVFNPSRDSPIVRFQHPAELKKTLSLSLENNSPTEDADLISFCKEIVSFSVKTGHPHFFNQLYGGVDIYGLAGAWITEALNTNQYTYEVAPVFSLIEKAVFDHVLRLIGFEGGDGIFAPGGSISNMYGMVLARYKIAPETKTKGLCCIPQLVALTSEDGHYSIKKGAHWLGLGTDNVVAVKTDERGRMSPSDLSKCIETLYMQRKNPFVVIATVGTTVFGAVDPVEEIADICEAHGLWLHVDACWGGSLLLSKKYRHLLKGVHRANSFSWNPHKMMGAPLQCSLFLVKEKGLLHHCNSASATYLFQQDKFYDVSYDTGDKSVQCGRKVDAFKLWLMWKARGDSGFGNLVDQAISSARYFRKKILSREGFRLVIPDFECPNVCFWFIPPSLRDRKETLEWWDELHKVAPKIKELLVVSGTLMIGYQPLAHKNLKNFFRLVVTCHPQTTFQDMDYVISEIERVGNSL